jgi:hypothetical protein
MDTLVAYLIRSILVSGLMLGYYHLALRNRRSHSFNRAWLLTTLLAGIVLPLVHVGWLTWHTAARDVVVLHSGGARPAPVATLSLAGVGTAACGAVSLLLLAILGWRIYRIYLLKRSRPGQRLGGCMLIEVRDRRAPFSFLRNLFWQEGADFDDPVLRRILDHELAHIRGGHTYDNLFAQTLAAVIWMNPFNWLIRRELQMVHEFIADDASVAAGDTETFALMLLRAYDDGRYFDPSHHFIHSPIQRRLRMISSSKPPSGLWKALALPVLLAGVVLACTKEQSAPATAQTNKPPEVAFKKPLQLTIQMKDPKIVRDSVQLAFSPVLKQILITGIAKANKDNKEVHILFDTLGVKGKLDLGPGIEIQGRDDKKPPPPPPAPQK